MPLCNGVYLKPYVQCKYFKDSDQYVNPWYLFHNHHHSNCVTRISTSVQKDADQHAHVHVHADLRLSGR